MRFGINTLDDFSFANKTVLLRVDINQPIDREHNALKSTARIKACIPTIRELADRGARIVILAHQGSDIEYANYFTTEYHRTALEDYLQRPVQFIDDVCGPAARERIQCLRNGEILLLDNVRFVAEEQTLFETKLHLSHQQQADTLLVRKLAPLAELYVNDAFAAAHRDQPSLCGFEQVLPSAMGRLFEAEYCALSKLMHSPQQPCVFVLGGAKIADAFLMMETVLSNGSASRVLSGGLVGNILLAAAGYHIGRGSMDFILKSNYGEYIDKASSLLNSYGKKICFPQDIAYVSNGQRVEADIEHIPDNATALDIGSATAKQYSRIIANAQTVFVNGPMGVFEQSTTELGTRTVWDALASSQAYSVVGGGDSVAATAKYNKMDDISYICTGGGAMIRFLTGEELPVVKALRHATATFPNDGGSADEA